MTTPAVIFEHVWKKFERGERHDSLRDLIPALAGRLVRRPPSSELQRQEFWAVRDVSFAVKPGEALGIIGPNGAGKSTILKLLTRILRPSRGSCEVRGRVGALIEVSAGFHGDLTGRENVYLQGAIMGMKRAEIATKFDAIVEFAGVSEFIDTPVKRYSSGMNARLGFAIAAHLEPDVLLIDEVLSVGDVAFQDKCLARMRELITRGIPIVFVSHNLPAVLELCTRTIVINRGVVTFDGDPGPAVQHYRHPPSFVRSDACGPAWISGAELLDGAGEPCTIFETGGPMRVRIHYGIAEPVRQPAFAVDIHRSDDVYCSGINTLMDARDLGTLTGSGDIDLVLPNLALLPGCYVVSVGILDSRGAPFDAHHRAYPFSIMSARRDYGVAYLDHMWESRAALSPVSVGAPDRCASSEIAHAAAR